MQIIVFLLSLTLSLSLWAHNRTADCVDISGNSPWSYCVYRQVESKNKDVIYFFHGSFGSNKRWNEGLIYKSLREHWAKNNIEAPVIVSVSYGPVWALLEKAPNPLSARLSHFVHQALPQIEKERLGPFSGRRLLMGESMGAYNALQIYFNYPLLFEKYFALCPAIWKVSPWSSWDELSAYQKSTGASWLKLVQMLLVVKWGFVNLETWNSGDPLQLAQKSEPRPPLYVSINEKDDFGLTGASRDFVNLAASSGNTVVESIQPGGHCSQIDPEAVTFFMRN